MLSAAGKNLKIVNTIKQSIIFLQSQQQKDGSFLSFSSSDPTGFTYPLPLHSPFPTALILSSLSPLENYAFLKNMRKQAIRFLKSQRSQSSSWNYWTRGSRETQELPYPDDLDVTFCALSSLFLCNNRYISGKLLADIVSLLTAVEEKEGGPYRTWLVPETADSIWKDVDLAVNCNIAYFLSLQGIALPHINAFVEERISSNNITSPYYPSVYPIIYFISRFYKGRKKKMLIKIILSHQDSQKFWGNPLNTALAISSLINLGYPRNLLTEPVRSVLQTQRKGRWKPQVFCIDPARKGKPYFAGSSALTTGFCIEALVKYSASEIVTEKETVDKKKKQQIYTSIMKQVGLRFSALDSSMDVITEPLLRALIKKDTTKQIPLLSYYFTSSLLQDKKENVPQSLLIQLGTANVFGWVAYTIFDNILDEEKINLQSLSAANLSLRELTVLFSNVLSVSSGFMSLFMSIMDDIENANAWEVMHCRVVMSGNNFLLKDIQLPDFSDYLILAKKSFGHCLGPLAVLYSLGLTKDSPEFVHVHNFFTHFLIAKQLNDDAHDWDKDLQKGYINPIGKMLLQQYKCFTQSTLRDALPKLREIFWYNTIDDICSVITEHITLARIALHKSLIIEDFSQLEQFLLPIEHSMQKALSERDTMSAFLKNYGNK